MYSKLLIDLFGDSQITKFSLQWHHNGLDGVSNHQSHYYLLCRLFGCRSNKTSKLRVTGLCAGTGEFPTQRASNAENVSMWWRHHELFAMLGHNGCITAYCGAVLVLCQDRKYGKYCNDYKLTVITITSITISLKIYLFVYVIGWYSYEFI